MTSTHGRVRLARVPASPSQKAIVSSRISTLPKEVLSRIIDFAGDTPMSFVNLALVSTLFASVALPLIRHTVVFSDYNQLREYLTSVKKGKKKDQSGTLRQIGSLTIDVDSIRSTAKSTNSIVSSLRNVLSSISSTLTTLSLLSAADSHERFHDLFPSTTTLRALEHLVHFHFDVEIWFHDLLPLLACWPKLRSITLGTLRSDCHARLPSMSLAQPQLVEIEIRKTTMTGTTIRFLLSAQTRLRSLVMPLPGDSTDTLEGRIAWKAIEKVVEGGTLQQLQVWNRMGTAAKRRKEAKKVTTTVAKGTGRAPVDDDEVDELASDLDEEENVESETAASVVLAPSPFDSVLAKPQRVSITTFLLTAAYLPSSPAPDSFNHLLPFFSHLTKLVIEDTATSGLRKAVVVAILAGGFPNLKELISVGTKKGRGGTAKKGKVDEGEAPALSKVDETFASWCKKRKIKWSIEKTKW